MEGPVPTSNGGAANQLQPVVMCRNPLDLTLLDLSIFQKKLEIQQLILITENNCVVQISL